MLRIGRISFIHNDPAYYYLEKNPPSGIQIVSASPRELLRLILREELEFAPISSVSIPPHSDKLGLVPALSVHSEGPALSASVIARKNGVSEILDGDQIAVTADTETAAVMLQLLMRIRKINVGLVESNQTSPAQLLREAPFALVIGNEALAALAAKELRIIFDLGEDWWNFTKQSAVFAVSVMRKSFLKDRAADSQRILDLVKESLEFGYANLGRVVDEAGKKSNLSPNLLEKYFRSLRLDYNRQVEEGYNYLTSKLEREG